MSQSDRLNGTFGFDPSEGQHHFLVVTPQGRSGGDEVVVHECPRFSEDSNVPLPVGSIERVRFSLPAWKALADQVRAVFNLRLKEAKRKPGKWKPGLNYLAPHYGKELVLLGWALEDVPAEKADTVFRNWRGLAPEERWWLYSTANAPFSQNSAKGRGLGWRKALTIALAENPLVDVPGETGLATVVVASEKTTPIPVAKKVPKKKAAKKRAAKKKAAAKKKSAEQNPTDSDASEDRHEPESGEADAQQTLFDL